MTFVCVSEPGESGHRFVQLLACDADGNEVGRKKVGGRAAPRSNAWDAAGYCAVDSARSGQWATPSVG
jgi:hypothetical protein